MRTRDVLWALVGSIAFVSSVAVAADEKPPSDLPDLTESSKLQAIMPKTVSGIVTLSGKGLEGARVTDGIDFVTTDKDGRYSITIKPDPLMPYLPSRTVAVSWPNGTWPALDEKTGRYKWWARLMDIKDSKNVNFELVPREVSLPMCVAFGTDPHDLMRSPTHAVYRDDIARVPGHVAFAVMGGDVGYASFGNSDEMFTSTWDFTRKFPVMLLHCIGNHDMVAKHIPWPGAPADMPFKHVRWFGAPHELAGYGGFTKYLNPTHWSFDCGGARFIGLDYGTLNAEGVVKHGVSESAIEWLEKDLKTKPKDAPAFVFNHQPFSPHQRFFDVCKEYNVHLCLGGDTHRNMFLYQGGMQGTVPRPGEPQYWTKMSFYTLIYVDNAGFDFVDVCNFHGARNGWDGAWNHDGRGCALYVDPPDQVATQQVAHVELKDVKLDSGSRELSVVKGETCDVRVGAKSTGSKPARRWGIRLTGKDGTAQEFAYDNKDRMLSLMGTRTPFDPAPPPLLAGKWDAKEQEWVEMRIYVLPDMVRVIVNSRVHILKPIKMGELKRIEFFAEEGSAEFGRVDAWQRTYPNYQPRVQFNKG